MPGPRKLKWQVISLLMRTFGRASNGISLGYRYGFDSGEMLDYVYENRPRGRFVYGPAVDRFYLNAIGWRAIRARKNLLKTTLRTIIDSNHERGQATTILDVASGPGRYLQELDGELEDTADLEIICRDLDPAGLEQGRAQAQRAGLKNIRYEVGDACDPASLAAVDPRPNLVVGSGLYELLLDPAMIQKSMGGIHALLPEEGHFVFTTQVTHPQLELIANVLPNRLGQPWVMVCRPCREVEGYARGAGFQNLSSRMEPIGLFAVTTASK